MNNWKNILIKPSTTIISTLQIIDAGARQLALVVDETNKLLGTVTDGDIRRGILKGISLESEVHLIMNYEPITCELNDSRENILAKMISLRLKQIPVINERGQIIDVELLDDLILSKKKNNYVIIMAGGLGTRLSPLTDECPKPLLKIGTKPILETIIENFQEHGFYKFLLSVNYRAEMIKEYFGDGSKWGIEISYLHENKRLGTAGALGLLPVIPNEPMIVMNGDLLTKVNFQQLLDFHKENAVAATMCVREYEFQVPYGVVKVSDDRMIQIEEKPTQRFFVNGGIYVIEPALLKRIPKDEYYDMPTLFDSLVRSGEEAAVFPIREYWIDIGRMDDFNRANDDVKENII